MVGTAEREIFYAERPETAFQDVVRALASVGNVVSHSTQTLTADARIRYGLQRTTVRVSVLPSADGSLIRIAGAGDDIWGVASRRASDKFVRALG